MIDVYKKRLCRKLFKLLLQNAINKICDKKVEPMRNDAFAHHLGNKTKCSTNRSKGCNGKGNKLTRIEAKEPSEDEVNFASQKRQ